MKKRKFKMAFVLGSICFFFSVLNAAYAEIHPLNRAQKKAQIIEDNQSCDEASVRLGILHISTIFNAASNTCWVSVHDTTSYKTLVYRDFMFGNDGLFMVFNSFGEGPESTMTGAREFFTFPRRAYPSFEVDTEKQLLYVKLSNGEMITIDGTSMRVLSMSGSQFIDDPEITPKNRGGIEIQSHTKILLDCGFKLGGSPTSNLNNSCHFSDSKGQRCRVKVKELFYKSSDGDSIFKFKTDQELALFITQRCSELDVTPLNQNHLLPIE